MRYKPLEQKEKTKLTLLVEAIDSCENSCYAKETVYETMRAVLRNQENPHADLYSATLLYDALKDYINENNS